MLPILHSLNARITFLETQGDGGVQDVENMKMSYEEVINLEKQMTEQLQEKGLKTLKYYVSDIYDKDTVQFQRLYDTEIYHSLTIEQASKILPTLKAFFEQTPNLQVLYCFATTHISDGIKYCKIKIRCTDPLKTMYLQINIEQHKPWEFETNEKKTCTIFNDVSLKTALHEYFSTTIPSRDFIEKYKLTNQLILFDRYRRFLIMTMNKSPWFEKLPEDIKKNIINMI